MQYFGGAPGYRELMDGRLPTIPIPSQANRTQAAGVGATKPRSTKPAGADLDLADWLATTEDNILALDNFFACSVVCFFMRLPPLSG